MRICRESSGRGGGGAGRHCAGMLIFLLMLHSNCSTQLETASRLHHELDDISMFNLQQIQKCLLHCISRMYTSAC